MSENIVEQPQFGTIKLLKPSDVACKLNISRSFAYFLLETGQLPTVHIGRSVRVKPVDLQAFIERNTTSGYGNF
jgi:excisionase family DNA binding protein